MHIDIVNLGDKFTWRYEKDETNWNTWVVI